MYSFSLFGEVAITTVKNSRMNEDFFSRRRLDDCRGAYAVCGLRQPPTHQSSAWKLRHEKWYDIAYYHRRNHG